MKKVPTNLAFTTIEETNRRTLLQRVVDLARKGVIMFQRTSKGYVAHEGEFTFKVWKEGSVHFAEFRGPNTPPITLRTTGGLLANDIYELYAIITWREEHEFAAALLEDIDNNLETKAKAAK